ncbi:putative isomerase YbhE [Hypoxylon rubiginosum]|uniref:Isomerase YbhE n=1 Tax=Hypoxylon rubiginosum TaxID=110542 RepID=A0ACC0CLA6_9PEZI|nr:putative isomerase YbhE [Hypoxylon rubiginosum]
MAHQGSVMTRLVVGSQDQILVLNFDGVEFAVTGGCIVSNFKPSRMLFREDNILHIVNTKADIIDTFTLGTDFSDDNNAIRLAATRRGISLPKLFLDKPTFMYSIRSSVGGTGIAFNADKTRLVEPCLEEGTIDVWDTSAADGHLRYLKSLGVANARVASSDAAGPHRAILDPTGRFFVFPNFARGRLIVMDANECEITNAIDISAGRGLNHPAFLTSDGVHYLVMLDTITNAIVLFELEYVGNTIRIARFVQQRDAHDGSPLFDRPGAITGGIEVAKNQRDIYISIRDYIVQFAFRKEGGVARLDYIGKTSTGLKPRLFALSTDTGQRFVFVIQQWLNIDNVDAESGLIALRRDPETGMLDSTPVAKMPNEEFCADHGLCSIVEI